ncbi:MAG: hypothetical protein ISR64_06400 [Deltaproteobacteria bacterium]|nr:hypothetical protein [Deltaproteobacteria bacterium]
MRLALTLLFSLFLVACGDDPVDDLLPDVVADLAPEIEQLAPFDPVLAESLQNLLEEQLSFSGDPESPRPSVRATIAGGPGPQGWLI